MTANPLSPIPPIGPTTGMTPLPGGSRFKPIDPIRVLRQHLWLLVALGVVGVLVGGASWYLLRRYAPRYTSQAQLQVSPANPDNVWAGVGSEAGGLNNDAMNRLLRNAVVYLQSEEVLREAINHPLIQQTAWLKSFRLGPADNRQVNILAALDDLQRNVLTPTPLSNTSYLNLSATTPTPDDAPLILQAVINVYVQKLHLQARSDTASLRSTFLAEEDRAQRTIDQLQEQQRQFLTTHSLTTLRDYNSAAAIEHQRLMSEYLTLQLTLDQAQGIYEALQQRAQSGDTAPSPDVLYEIEQMPGAGVAQRNEELRSLREHRDALLARFGPIHREIQNIDKRIAAVEAERKRTIDRLLRERQAAQLAQAAKSVEALKGQLAAMEPKLTAATKRMTDFTERINRYNQMEQLLKAAQADRQRVADALADLRIQQDRPDAIRVRAMTKPSSPEMSFPRLVTIVPGITLLLLAAGTGGIFLKELLDQRVKSPADVKLLADVDLLSVLPAAGEDPGGFGGDSGGESGGGSGGKARIERVVERDPRGLLAESFRQLRSAVLSKMERRGYKSLVVAAAQPGSGASSVAQNLATSLAYNGRNVLLLDANLRRPTQHKLMGLPGERGLVDVLRGETTLDAAITPIAGLSLSVLPAGNTHDAPPELLECAGFRALLSQLETRYDMIVIDSPPALLASDCQLLSKQVDAIALVVRAGVDKRGMIERMIHQLDGQRADVLGIVLNGVRSSAGGYFRKSYREFYRYRQHAAPAASDSLRRNGERKTADVQKSRN